MGSNDTCNFTSLALGLGFPFGRNDQNQSRNQHIKDMEKLEREKYLLLKFNHDLPSLSLGSLQPKKTLDLPSSDDHGQTSSMSPGSSYSNSSTVKKDRVRFDIEDFEVNKGVSSRMSNEDEEASPRKKLRLNKEQSAVLEDNFKEHSTLNPKQKQALARKLNLRPRQVEVWFQNRRARTKFKQTEIDCEVLKKCYDSLTEENKRLHRELQELRGLNLSAKNAAVFMHMPAATLTTCPSCDRVKASASGGFKIQRAC